MANEVIAIYDSGCSLTFSVYYDNAGTITARETDTAMTEEPADSGVYKGSPSTIEAGDTVVIKNGSVILVAGEYRPIAAFVTAIFAKIGITAGGTWTFAKILKVLTAWAAGKWQDKSGSPGTYEVLDAEDGTTKIAEATPSETTPQKQVTIL